MDGIARFNFALFIEYLLLVLFIGLQLIRIVYYRHKIRSFQVGFLSQCFLWALLRAAFFLLITPVSTSNWIYLPLYWFPINIQYSTFSLLVVYYAYLGFSDTPEINKFKRNYIALWIITNVLFLIVALVLIGIGIKVDGPGGVEPRWLSSIHGCFNGIVFFILVVVLAWHGRKIAHLMRKGSNVRWASKISLRKIAIVTGLLFLLFTSRMAYNVIMAFGLVDVEIDGGTNIAGLITFTAFTLWEVIPTILVLVLFGKVNSTTLGVFSLRKKNTFPDPSYGSLNGTDPARFQIFNDPKRYDSDEETSTLRASSVILYGATSTSSSESPV